MIPVILGFVDAHAARNKVSFVYIDGIVRQAVNEAFAIVDCIFCPTCFYTSRSNFAHSSATDLCRTTGLLIIGSQVQVYSNGRSCNK